MDNRSLDKTIYYAIACIIVYFIVGIVLNYLIGAIAGLLLYRYFLQYKLK